MTEETEMTERSVEIDLTPTGTGFKIVVDGVDLAPLCRGVIVRSWGGEPTEVVLDLMPRPTIFTGRAQVTTEVDGLMRALLIEAGWTPPAGDAR